MTVYAGRYLHDYWSDLGEMRNDHVHVIDACNVCSGYD